MTDLDRFLDWCRKCGHYQPVELAENFQKFEALMKERETEALRLRAKNDE